jgi:hypothetical protein
MLDDCFRKIAFDEAGTIDYDRVATRITTSERNRFTAGIYSQIWKKNWENKYLY